MNWIELRALNNLYRYGSAKYNETLKKSKEIGFLIDSLNAIELGHRSYIASDKYKLIYERDYLNQFTAYETFLSANNLLKPQTQYEEADIRILMKLQGMKEDGVLDELRSQIIAADTSLRNISLMFFKSEKYLDNRCSLIEALKQILEVDEFSNEKDQQYIYKLECHNTVAIVLCENLDFLTKPAKPRKHGIELWYVGGKNVGKLDYSQTRGLPIYYSCDWDYDGLFIIFPLVKEKIPGIQLLIPNGSPKSINETGHGSKWPSGLNINSVFEDNNHYCTISELIQKDQWIIEESNDLLRMLEHIKEKQKNNNVM
ncbi:hypothetical protein [Flavihumibacter sp. CACIAM 22H1]|uniref:hypothetical protein n=1 Tax=Flavihumibacter sp. CACIAM 22H1 TaxID=1812911 RepID=UPI0007A8BE32|nr:hypothetical protein [Flavihumibacter sp. CACIAM 22H1]KYP15937.1 MAG: hypothetical protein A1D16_06325 [Flavihumibacter sp. CACIAM 22H1]